MLKQSEQVKGFDKLTDQHKNQFTNMLKDFYSGWEFPEKWQPVKVIYVKEDNYLRVDFTRKRWLHFLPNGTWY